MPDIDAARAFYDAVIDAIGVSKVYDRPGALGYGTRCSAYEDFHSYLAVYESNDATLDSKRHWCFKARARAEFRLFHLAGLANGGKDDGCPGVRANYQERYFGAFLLDPSRNRIEAVCHRAEPEV